MAYSIDFRKKVLSYCDKTGNISEAAEIFQISRNTIYEWIKLQKKTGDLHHQVKGTKPRKVDRDKLKAYLEAHPDAYLTEIASEFDCHPTAIHYALKAMGYTPKKKSCTYYEQDPEKVALFLKEFTSLKHLTPVYIDETGFETYFYREYGRSMKGQLIEGKVSGRRYQRISLVVGLTNGEIIAPMTYEDTMTSDFFEAWFQQFLLPALDTPSVIIMDKARFHRMSSIKSLCEEQGHKLLPLPPYSPEYNPIEKIWAHIKKHLRKVLPNYDTFLEALLSHSSFS
ncbi:MULTISPECIES: IS630 family transposase [unclassified Streptococcus]|uniref:IS630 family transposase n=2 Tax=unclassified Streptococcus TaxID=2608887 RepID=UPI0010724060|nr:MULTISPECIES: IS630 family transposase [unclassified Streptococcus]MBF0805356.1 IS630 family transposase [Streptococcus sp. 19428wA2_WM07]TFU29197.1 IS630 family transposase [Streptococcus sp. WM07]